MKKLTYGSVVAAILALLVAPALGQDPGDVGSPECLAVQLEAQTAVGSGGPYRNHGQLVRTAARSVSPHLEADDISEECSSCIVHQFARRIPVDGQESCGPCVFSAALFSEEFPPSDKSESWDAFEAQLSAGVTYNKIEFFSNTDSGYTCTGPDANTICQAIRTQTNEACDEGLIEPLVIVECDSNTWAVGLCFGTEVSVNSDFCDCSAPGTTIRAEIAQCEGSGFYGAVNGNTCEEGETTTMTVMCSRSCL